MKCSSPSGTCFFSTNSCGLWPMDLELWLPILQVQVGPHRINKGSPTLLMCDFPSEHDHIYFLLRTFSSLTGGSRILLAILWCLAMYWGQEHGPPSWISRVTILHPSFPISTHSWKLSIICLMNIDYPGSVSSLLLFFSQLKILKLCSRYSPTQLCAHHHVQ